MKYNSLKLYDSFINNESYLNDFVLKKVDLSNQTVIDSVRILTSTSYNMRFGMITDDLIIALSLFFRNSNDDLPTKMIVLNEEIEKDFIIQQKRLFNVTMLICG